MAATDEKTSQRWEVFPDPDAHERIARLSAALPLRPDAERIRHLLAEAFADHVDDLWPAGTNQGSPKWIAANVDSILATIERLYAVAVKGEHPGADEFLDRMGWLPPLLVELEGGAVNLDG